MLDSYFDVFEKHGFHYITRRNGLTHRSEYCFQYRGIGYFCAVSMEEEVIKLRFTHHDEETRILLSECLHEVISKIKARPEFRLKSIMGEKIYALDWMVIPDLKQYHYLTNPDNAEEIQKQIMNLYRQTIKGKRNRMRIEAYGKEGKVLANILNKTGNACFVKSYLNFMDILIKGTYDEAFIDGIRKLGFSIRVTAT